jgi:hypothetical protein
LTITLFLEPELIQSLAFQKVSGTAVKVLIWFLRRRQLTKVGRAGKEKWVIKNNGEIVFTYPDAKKNYGLTGPRFKRALEDLVAKGFIDINHHGGGMVGDFSTYYISDRWRNFGTEKFNLKSLPKDTRGLGFTSKNWEERTRKKKRTTEIKGNENVTHLSNKNVTDSQPESSLISNKNVIGEVSNNLN